MGELEKRLKSPEVEAHYQRIKADRELDEQQETEVWALYYSEQYENGDPNKLHSVEVRNTGSDDYRPCMITPKSLWDQRQEALREALAALEHFAAGDLIMGVEEDESRATDAIAKLRALPGMGGEG